MKYFFEFLFIFILLTATITITIYEINQSNLNVEMFSNESINNTQTQIISSLNQSEPKVESFIVLKKDFYNVTTDINIILLNQSKLKQTCFELTGIDSQACTVLNIDGSKCVMYLPELSNVNFTENDINTWGHELMHCIYGSWH